MFSTGSFVSFVCERSLRDEMVSMSNDVVLLLFNIRLIFIEPFMLIFAKSKFWNILHPVKILEYFTSSVSL